MALVVRSPSAGGRWLGVDTYAKGGRDRGARQLRWGGVGHVRACVCACAPMSLRLKNIWYTPFSGGMLAGGGEDADRGAVLRGVNLEVALGSLHVVTGRSGAGKSTLLYNIAGLSLPDSGSVEIAGEMVFPQRGHRKGRKKLGNGSGWCNRVGVVFQFPERHFLADTVGKELLWGHDSESIARAKQPLEEALAGLDMTHIPMDTPIRTLSGGYQRRLAIAVQLSRRPSLLLMDEPLAGLDWRTRDGLLPILRRIADESAVLVVSHELEELRTIRDKEWKLNLGTLEPVM